MKDEQIQAQQENTVFSSRRRHTRCLSDWSSDVCSSDLYRAIKPEIDAAIAHALENAQFVLGPAVAAFEKEFAPYTGAAFAIGLNSGTSALHLALLAASIG